MVSFAALSAELIVLVANEIRNTEGWSGSLASLVRVSKSAYASFIPELYREIRLKKSARHLLPLAYQIFKNPALGSFVQYFDCTAVYHTSSFEANQDLVQWRVARRKDDEDFEQRPDALRKYYEGESNEYEPRRRGWPAKDDLADILSRQVYLALPSHQRPYCLHGIRDGAYVGCVAMLMLMNMPNLRTLELGPTWLKEQHLCIQIFLQAAPTLIKLRHVHFGETKGIQYVHFGEANAIRNLVDPSVEIFADLFALPAMESITAVHDTYMMPYFWKAQAGPEPVRFIQAPCLSVRRLKLCYTLLRHRETWRRLLENCTRLEGLVVADSNIPRSISWNYFSALSARPGCITQDLEVRAETLVCLDLEVGRLRPTNVTHPDAYYESHNFRLRNMQTLKWLRLDSAWIIDISTDSLRRMFSFVLAVAAGEQHAIFEPSRPHGPAGNPMSEPFGGNLKKLEGYLRSRLVTMLPASLETLVIFCPSNEGAKFYGQFHAHTYAQYHALSLALNGITEQREQCLALPNLKVVRLMFVDDLYEGVAKFEQSASAVGIEVQVVSCEESHRELELERSN